jgi:hypothetical protein
MLAEKPFRWCEVFCRHFRIGKIMFRWILHSKLGLKKFHLRWAPHALPVNPKTEGVSYSKRCLTVPIEHKLTYFERVITHDKSWFFLHHSRDLI